MPDKVKLCLSLMITNAHNKLNSSVSHKKKTHLPLYEEDIFELDKNNNTKDEFMLYVINLKEHSFAIMTHSRHQVRDKKKSLERLTL